MSTLAEVEAAVAGLSSYELEELERLIRQQRRIRSEGRGRSPLDLPALDLGKPLLSLGERGEWLDEMLEGRV
jgi:hypothetical protein